MERIKTHAPYVRRMADQLSARKRLTEPDLAAEAYRQMTRAIAESGVITLLDERVAPGDALTFGPVRRETARIATIKRFASYPHYDD